MTLAEQIQHTLDILAGLYALRNEDIVRRYGEGTSAAKLAEEYHLTRQGVHHILRVCTEAKRLEA